LGSCLLLAPGCGPDESRRVELEVYSWWTETSERVAFERLDRLYEAEHPNVEVRNQVDSEASVTRASLRSRILAGAPPSTFLANVGADLMQWTTVDYLVDGEPARDRRIEDVRGLLEESAPLEAFPDVVLDSIRLGERIYAVPLNLHRLNLLYYNAVIVERYEREHGRSLLDLAVLCPEDSTGAEPLDATVAIGTRDPFSLVLFAFEAVLPALAGPSFYERLFRGEAPASSSGGDWTQDVRRALACVKYLSRSFIDGHEGRTWADAAELVANEDAAFTVMGDWVNGELSEFLDDGSVRSVPFPGSETVFVFTSDSFPLPVEAPHLPETRRLLALFATPEAQLAFSAVKGSIPARRDLDVSGLGGRAETTANDFDASTQLLATSGSFPYYFPTNELGLAVRDMLAPEAGEEAVEAVVELLRDTYPLLARWQARLREGAASEP
jgi:glucose/mannose transport system substrate-binding protein